MKRYGCFLIACLLLALQSGCGTTVQPGQRGLRWYPFTEGLTTTCSANGGFYVGLLTQPVEGRPSQYGLPVNARLLLTVADVRERTVVMLTYGPGDQAEFGVTMEPIRDLIATFRFD